MIEDKICETPSQSKAEPIISELWNRKKSEWNQATGDVWYRQFGIWSDGESLHVNFQTNQKLEGASLVTTLDGGMMEQRQWRESSALLSKNKDVWEVSAAVPARITAWFINLKSGQRIAISGLVDLG